MNDEYASKLIYLLDQHSSEDQLKDVLNEMENSPREVFIYPVLGSYNKFKNTPISHYFISVLGAINTTRTISILKDLFVEKDTKWIDKIWILPYLKKNGVFEEPYINFCLYQLFSLKQIGVMEKEYSDEYDLDIVLSYLKAAEKLGENLDLLLSILLNNKNRRIIRKRILYYWLRENTDDRLNYLIAKYKSFNDDDFDIILAEELKRWKGSKVNSLIKLIKENGYPQAKEILENNKNNELKKNVQKIEIRYPNIELIKEISILRNKINFSSQQNQNLKFKIFKEAENLITQQQSINNQEELITACINLRDILQNLTSEATKHTIEIDEARKYVPNINEVDLNKSLNALHLNLTSKGIAVSQDLFGFKILNQAVSLIAAHPNEVKNLIKTLTKLNLTDSYKEDNWQDIHTKLLITYKKSLEELLEALIKK